MIQELLRDLKQKITVDTVQIRDSYLLYGEYSKKSKYPGIAYFEHFNIDAFNLTNNFSAIPDTTNLRVSLTTHVMGDALLKANLIFPLFSKNDEFTLKASSDRMDMPLLSKLTQNILGIAIVSGKAKLVYADIHGDNTSSSGTMLFKYRKLKTENVRY